MTNEDLECLQLGRGVKLAGLKLAAGILQKQIKLMEGQLGIPGIAPVNGPIRPAMQRTLEAAGIAPPGLPAPKKRRGRPPKIFDTKVSKAAKGYWAKMTPAERSTEMKRRQAKWKAGAMVKRTIQPNHPRNKDHPKHKQWLAKMKKAMRKSWDSLTPTVREERIKAALGGRGVKRKTAPTVKLKP
jgi:hypothetical protein